MQKREVHATRITRLSRDDVFITENFKNNIIA